MLVQALPVLQAKFAIKRALMRLQIQVPKANQAEAMNLLDKLEAEIESRDFSNQVQSRLAQANLEQMQSDATRSCIACKLDLLEPSPLASCL